MDGHRQENLYHRLRHNHEVVVCVVDLIPLSCHNHCHRHHRHRHRHHHHHIVDGGERSDGGFGHHHRCAHHHHHHHHHCAILFETGFRPLLLAAYPNREAFVCKLFCVVGLLPIQIGRVQR